MEFVIEELIQQVNTVCGQVPRSPELARDELQRLVHLNAENSALRNQLDLSTRLEDDIRYVLGEARLVQSKLQQILRELQERVMKAEIKRLVYLGIKIDQAGSSFCTPGEL